MKKERISADQVELRLNIPKKSRPAYNRLDMTAYKEAGYYALAYRPNVHYVYYNPEKNIMVLDIEGDHYIVENPTHEQLQEQLRRYPRSKVTGTGEKYDDRFDRGKSRALIHFHKYAPDLDNRNLPYEWHKLGLSVKIDWDKAFDKLGFKEVTEKEVKESVGEGKFHRPKLESSNTSTYNTFIANHINFGVVDISTPRIQQELGGKTLLTYRKHKGGDIRGRYSERRYMVHSKSKNELTPDLSPLFNLRVVMEAMNKATGKKSKIEYSPLGHEHLYTDELNIGELHETLFEKSGTKRKTEFNLAKIRAKEQERRQGRRG